MDVGMIDIILKMYKKDVLCTVKFGNVSIFATITSNTTRAVEEARAYLLGKQFIV